MSRQNQPDPESHWYPSDPAAQPAHEAVTSLNRLIQEVRAQLGPGADAAAICEELKRRGVDANADEVRRICQPKP
jgi:hypothetical protein